MKIYYRCLLLSNPNKILTTERKEFIISKQLFRSATSIGANIREAQNAESTADFIHKLSISLKESGETEYWLELLVETNYISQKEFISLHHGIVEIIKLLTTIIKKSKEKNTQ
ncbi:MAG: four helix bundle protein [Bacteroidales bacterium]|nr:four helix bundle protein [Bacteroidales bacterium]